MITITINFHMLLQYKTSIYNGFSIAMLNNQRVLYFHMLNPLLDSWQVPHSVEAMLSPKSQIWLYKMGTPKPPRSSFGHQYWEYSGRINEYSGIYWDTHILPLLLTCEFSTSTLRWLQTCALDEAQILGTLRIAIAQAPSPARHIHHAAVADTSDVPGARNKEIR